ncbi:mechanosensitive ion channel domain-containing protein [Flavobacterium sp.]|uniref:mechanosensitive ion channel family protein n=1 Tax=Flavobacterium sp. TaxID=239 RepID=UPI002621233E|nr:mechanosensitive ion channel domain-containing protein [Flavobacterium sp.]MDD2986563.1 mechanosensitive ion channel [Flavobacterium sp.]
MEFFKLYIKEEIASGVVILMFFFLRYFMAKLIRRFARVSEALEHRSNLVIKYFNILIGTVCVIALFVIWGVKPQDLIIVISSLFAVIGVAMFAQWSILSNVTSGIILFFSAPFKIGDNIKIHDKEFPIEGEVEDIRGFHTYVRTPEGEVITYPNSLLLQKGISVVAHKKEIQEFTD